MTKDRKNLNWNVILIITAAFALLSVILLVSGVVSRKLAGPKSTEVSAPTEPASYMIMDNFNNMVSEDMSEAYNTACDVKKVFWIEEDAEIAPKPNANCYGEAKDPASLQWLLDDAAEILDGQELIFSTDTEIYPDSTITYYLDDSIFVVTWQQVFENFVYTISEVKVSHPSQFRRYLAGNEYNSDYMHTVSRMGNMANAVMAASADYYRGRNHGIIVYEGEVKRTDHAEYVDTCFIDENGDLILVPAGDLITMEEAQAFVDEHDINFSLAFGPILVNDGVRCEPPNYYLGEVNDKYPRAALGQKDKLHYVVVTANAHGGYWTAPNIHTFAECITLLNCQKAYTLDGGQTGTISMQGKAKNPRQTSERWVSDIIYFATAIPSTEEIPETTEP